jgi:tetratricopeptide (TPR) repeat protein
MTVNEPDTLNKTSVIEQKVHDLQVLIQSGQYELALKSADALRTEVPENRDVAYMRAVALRYLNRIADALAALAELEKRNPGFSRLYQEQGHCYVALRDAPKAIEAYQKAVHRNPALPAAWSRLVTLYRMTGDEASARTAQQHVDITSKMHPAIITATGLLSDGDVSQAEKIIRPYLLQNPQDVEAMRILARIALEFDVLHDADFLLEAVIELAPDYRAARYDYARALLRRHRHQVALEQLDILLKEEPENRMYKTTYATTWVGLGDHEKALKLYQELLVGAPNTADLHLSIAHTLKTLGRTDESIEEYRRAADARPHFGDAFWSLANLKTYRFTSEEIDRMIASEANPDIDLLDRYHMCFALGKALEDRGDYARSFEYYERGNALKKSDSPFMPELVEKNTAEQKQVCTPEFFSARQGWGCPDPAPIFVVGLPRSGSTSALQSRRRSRRHRPLPRR